MRTRTGWLALLLTVAGMGLAPATGWGQEYPPADPVWPLPLYHDRPDTGGMYTALEFALFHQTNPLEHQLIAVRGFYDIGGVVTGVPGAFVGTGQPALYADDAGGPGTYQPGWIATVGWRFEDGLAVEVSWLHLAEARYAAEASTLPPGLQPGPGLADTFLTSFVYNFPNDFAGPPNKVNGDNGTGSVYGIWNGAAIMNINFTQRYDQIDGTARIPVYQDDDKRFYGLCGPRFAWVWENFGWRTVSQDVNGNAGQDDVAEYSNVVSNRMYGVHVGCGMEWRCADTPAGTFSVSLDAEGAGLIDIVKLRAKYERADRETASQRSLTDYKFVPEVNANIQLMWYPIEGVQMRVGYDVMAFFNTLAAQNPVSFNYGGLDPAWEHEFRFFDGFNAGIGIIF